MKMLLFAGTSDGVKLTEYCRGKNIELTVCVATDYAPQFLENTQDYTLLVGRKSPAEIEALLKENDILVDATHPFAEVVSSILREKTKQTGVPYYRLLREEVPIPDFVHRVPSYEAALDYLKGTTGNILLATGVKTAGIFASDSSVLERCFIRILPMMDSLQQAIDAGYAMKRIIAMQGPFTDRMNSAIIDQYDIEIMVTKESGRSGGLEEKIRAAKACGINLVLITKPEETGYKLEELKEILEKIS